MEKFNYHSLIIGGTGQFGMILRELLTKKKKKVVITTRHKKLIFKRKLYKTIVLDILNKKKIRKVIREQKPKNIFYFAGQSSPFVSFKKKKETTKSNFVGCKNVLEAICEENKKINFIYASSSEMYGKVKGKINLRTRKNPVNPYGEAKLKGFNITKFFREKYDLKASNAIIFNTESLLRDKSFFIPKVCLAAIDAHKYNKKTSFGNLKIMREWNWCKDQCEILVKFLKKKPQDFILSNGKCLSAHNMLNFAFQHFNLNYKEYILTNNKLLRPTDIKIKRSNCAESFKKNNIKKKNFIYGKKLINLMIKGYLKS